MAARRFCSPSPGGTQQHRWNFGDMVPQPRVRRMEAEAIIKFVREVQRANGIE